MEVRSEFMRISVRSVCCRPPTTRTVHIALRIGIGLVFVYASLDKVIHPDQFAEVMQDYEILPKTVVSGAALWLAWLEVVVGILLTAGVWVRAAGLMVTGLTVVFIGGISIALTRGIGLHCGCFSTDPGGEARTWVSLWQEGLLLLACLWLTVRTFADAIKGTEDRRSAEGQR
jgi:uncharacterized membrane protein YphA (DoxX/SURF4 family)